MSQRKFPKAWNALCLLEGFDALPELMQGDMLDAAVGAQRFESSLALIRHALGSASLGGGKPDAALPRMESGQRAHEQGYALARAVRERVKQGTCARLDLDGALDALQWKGLRVLRDDWSSLDRNVKAAVGFSSGVPRVLARPAPRGMERFVISRGIFALLSHATEEGPRLITSAGTRFQAASRAFAAELLAPAAAIRARMRDGIDEDRIEELASEFDVSSMVIQHQIENHRLLR